MTDFLNKVERSERMSLIRAKDTRPELVLRRALHAKGFRYRLHASDLPGKPDIVLPKFGSVIFVHGCFWHGHRNCRIANSPKTNSEFWQKKFTTNARRDRRSQRRLKLMGWKVIVVWECEVRSKDKLDRTVKRVARRLRGFLAS